MNPLINFRFILYASICYPIRGKRSHPIISNEIKYTCTPMTNENKCYNNLTYFIPGIKRLNNLRSKDKIFYSVKEFS